MIYRRSAEILRCVLNNGSPVTVAELANLFGVSERTIRYDLDSLREWLKDNGFPDLMKKRRVGVYLEQSNPEVRKRIINALKAVDSYSYVLSPEERYSLIIIILLTMGKPITSEQLADKLSVSRSTIVSDLIKVEEELSKYNLLLKKKRGVGICVSGNEKSCRQAVLDFLPALLDIDNPLKFINFCAQKDNNVSGRFRFYLRELFQDIDIDIIEDLIMLLQKKLGVGFNDDSLARLIVHVAIAIRRLKMGYDISMPEVELQQLQETEEFQYSLELCKSLEEEFNVVIPRDEVGYITIHLLGARYHGDMSYNAAKHFEKLLNRDSFVLAKQIIVKAKEALNVDFGVDPQLLDYLALHLKPTLHRLKFGLPIVNPLLNDIKKNYPRLFNVTSKIMNEVLRNWSDVSVSEAEIGYIAMHLGAALYRIDNSNNSSQNVRVLVVCSTGLASAEMLASRLKSEFKNIELVDALSYNQIRKSPPVRDVDLVVSTVPLDDLGIKHILVNPLLPENDLHRLKMIMGSGSKGLDVPVITDKVIKLISRYTNISDFEKIKLQRELASILSEREISSEPALESSLPTLADLISPSAITLNVKVQDWEEAIRRASAPLVELGFIEKRYVKAMIDAVKTHGPFVVVSKGIAMPHSGPQDGVIKAGMSLLTLKEPVDFGDSLLDPVDIVVVLAPVDDKVHLKALFQLVKLFRDPQSAVRIKTATSIKDVLEVITADQYV